jgi:molecular chaperone DnaK (HSP70)
LFLQFNLHTSITHQEMASFAGNNANQDGARTGDSLILGDVRDDCKPVVVGIDFGTAFSGVAFAFREIPGNVKYGAPSTTDPLQTKVPTALLETPDGRWEFGYSAEMKYNEILSATESGEVPAGNLYKRFKMVLKGKESGFDTLTALSVSGKSCKLMTLVVKALEFLKDYAMSLVRVSYGGDLIPTRDVQWVLTVPAIWNEFGKAFMRKAAFKAGMMETEQSDNLMLVLEPEGAALAVHVGAMQHGLLGVASRFMVLDCGGGTIDITVHDVETLRPLSMKAIMAPAGGDWGGERINTEFKKFLKELLGPDGAEEQSSLLEFYTIYTAFEKMKVMYDPETDPANISLIDVLNHKGQLVELATEWNKNHPEKPIVMSPLARNGFLAMSKALMLSFFEPSLKETVEETRRVMRAMPGIKHIMVVGGFGSSKVLTARIRAEFHNKMGGVQVIMPDSNPKPQGAIVHGAVYFGLYKDIISSRVAAYSYGVAVREDGVDEVFSILVTKGEELPNDHEATLSGIPVTDDQDALTWRVYRSDKAEPTLVTGEHLLGRLTADCPADPIRANRRQTGKFNFGGSEIRVTIEDARGGITKGEISMV